MKIKFILILFTLSVIVKCNLMAAVTRPVILSLGTFFAVMNQDAIDIQPTEWRNYIPFTAKKKEKPFKVRDPNVLDNEVTEDEENDLFELIKSSMTKQ